MYISTFEDKEIHPCCYVTNTKPNKDIQCEVNIATGSSGTKKASGREENTACNITVVVDVPLNGISLTGMTIYSRQNQ